MVRRADTFLDPIRAQVIRAALVKAGTTQTEIARQLQLPRQRVCDVIHGRRRHATIQKAVAKVLGSNPEQIFGELTCRQLRGAA